MTETNKPSNLNGWEFIEGFVDDLRHLEEAFQPPAHFVTGFSFTRRQVSTLINVFDTVLAMKRSVGKIDDAA